MLKVINKVLVLTCFSDVEWQPEEEGITDQLGKQQTQRELNHSLGSQTHTSDMVLVQQSVELIPV